LNAFFTTSCFVCHHLVVVAVVAVAMVVVMAIVAMVVIMVALVTMAIPCMLVAVAVMTMTMSLTSMDGAKEPTVVAVPNGEVGIPLPIVMCSPMMAAVVVASLVLDRLMVAADAMTLPVRVASLGCRPRSRWNQ